MMNPYQNEQVFSKDPFSQLELTVEALAQNFTSYWQCIHCQQTWNSPKDFQLFGHIQDCLKKQGIKFGKVIVQNQSVPSQLEDQLNEMNDPSQKPQIICQGPQMSNEEFTQKEVRAILETGNISEGSKKQYKGPLKAFFSWLWNQGKNDPNAFDIENYIKKFNPKLAALQALNRLKEVKKIYLKKEQRYFMKQSKKLLKEQQKKDPNKSWGINLIQMLLNDLVFNNMNVLAFRVYILYTLGARISELKQITFQMICEGEVNYIPQKQQKRGEKARRILVLNNEVIQVTQEFMKLRSIASDQYLNVGELKSSVNYNSMQKQLSKALNYIRNSKVIQSKDYNDFLTGFSYHDLRHSKLMDLYGQGIEMSDIQIFVSHYDKKVTQNYVKSNFTKKCTIDGKVICENPKKKLELTLKFKEGERIEK